MPDYLCGVRVIVDALGLAVTVAVTVEGAGIADVAVPTVVCGGSGPDPSGSTTVVAVCPGSPGRPVTGELVSVGFVSVGLTSVVVVGVVVVVFG
jgi:hypothetical protein